MKCPPPPPPPPRLPPPTDSILGLIRLCPLPPNPQRNRPRTELAKFIREAFMRKHGFRNVANKAFSDLAAAARHFAESDPDNPGNVRAR